jgi:DNA polymerase III subunit delta
MVALKTSQIDAFLARPNPGQPIVLVYGPDAGLVRERAEALIRSAVDDPNNPFSLVRLEGDALAAEPTRLVEEVNTIPLFGGRRAVWVKTGRNNFVAAVEALAAAPAPDCRIVIEAGDLKRNAPLRVLCERAKNAAALPCYVDAEKDLARLIDEELRAASLSITPQAREMLVPLLGGDRLASRSELRKLALYARGKGRVDVEDVIAVVADASTVATEAAIDAAFTGNTQEVEIEFGKARNAGTSPGSILSTALRHVAMLHKARLAVEAGQPASAAAQGFYGDFRRRELIEAMLRAWSSARLQRAMLQLADAAFEGRRRADLAEAIAHRTLLSIAVQAPTRK